MASERYSFSLTTFSPSGKLVQIEYALMAVSAGAPSVGIKVSWDWLTVVNTKIWYKFRKLLSNKSGQFFFLSLLQCAVSTYFQGWKRCRFGYREEAQIDPDRGAFYLQDWTDLRTHRHGLQWNRPWLQVWARNLQCVFCFYDLCISLSLLPF